MKLVFNDSLTSTVKNDNSQVATGNIVTSGIILEKKVVTAATINTVTELVDAFMKLTSDAERKKLLNSTDAQNIFKDPNNLAEFLEKTRSSSSGSKVNSGSDPVAMANQMMMEAADSVGQPASKFAPFLSQKDQIIARLKPFMSDQEIGEIFYRFDTQAKLAFTETIGILEFCIQQSRSCNSKVKDLIDFYLEHYSQKRQSANTKRIIQTACEYQKLNPTIDIFSVLRDAIAGNQPKVGLGYLSKDPDSQLIFNNLIMLSQASLPEQSEEIRRRYQESRDALQNMQQKVNMQKAIYDMMKTEEMNLQLARIIQSLGTAFEALITQPMYRALKDMYYDINAGKVIMNQVTSIFGADTSSETKRSEFDEQQAENENNFPGIRDTKNVFYSDQNRFVKLASPEVTRHIYAQTAPEQTKPVDPKVKNDVLSGLDSLINSAISSFGKIITTLTGFLKDVGQDIYQKALGFINTLKSIFDAIQNGIRKLINGIISNNVTIDMIEQVFSPIIESINGISSGGILGAVGGAVGGAAGALIGRPSNTPTNVPQRPGAPTTSPGFKPPANAKLRVQGPNANINYNRVAQRSPQQENDRGNVVQKYIYNGIGIFSSIGTFILGAIYGPRLLAAALKSGNWQSVLNSVGFFVLLIKNNLIELFMSTGLVGGKVPQSNLFFDGNGNPTERGLQILANNQEVMIALGLSDEDAMALSKFSIQKEILMQQLRTKESNLQNAESQAVQTGNPRQPINTVGDLPLDFQSKLKDFLDFCEKVELQFKAAINLFRNAINANQSNYNDAQKLQASGKLAEFEKDLIEVQAKKSEWSSIKNIAARIIRMREWANKLLPLETQLDTAKKLGIPMANIIASPNGILAHAGRIRNEQQQALVQLRKDYYEKLDLLKNPDISTPLTKYPIDTGVTKLPQSPDQSESNKSPFEVDKNSTFKTDGDIKDAI